MKTPTPTKAEEIELLQRLTVQAREAGADYLHEALIALAAPFENAIRADFPGDMAVYSLLDTLRDLRKDILKENAALTEARQTLAKTQEETREAVRQLERGRTALSEMRSEARRLAAA
jgi:hypothetical protein